MRNLTTFTGRALTDEEFARTADTAPLSAWRTAGYAVRDAAEQGVTGTVVRAAELPPLAVRVERTGRWSAETVVDTPEDAAARGDKLYETEDAYKGSPFYRETVPFEPGMTESRAVALARQQDLKAIRQFYTEKRPVASFIGSVAGAALAPENYIPIVNEAAGVALTARLGKIAGRALGTSVDAAANTALFQTLTAPERAQLGDDTSWQAIGENAAYAALAGFLFGGAVGAVGSRAEAKAARKAAGGLPPTDAPLRSKEGGSAPSGTAATDLSSGGSATGQLQPVWRAAPDILETPAMRAKAGQAFNDAVSGLALEGEVRLGAASRDAIDAMQAEFERRGLDQAWTSVRAQPTGPVNDPLVVITPQDIEGVLVSRGAFKNINEMEFAKRGYGLVKIIWRHGPESTAEPSVQIAKSDVLALPEVVRNYEPTSVSADGLRREWRVALPNEEFGPRTVVFADSAFGGGRHLVTAYVDNGPAPLSEKKKPVATGSAPQAVDLAGDTATGPFDRTPGGQSSPAGANVAPDRLFGKTSAAFTVPPPEPPPQGLLDAYKAVDAFPKEHPPAKAQLPDAVKAEGLDPATGGHDLEADIDIMRELGALKPEDEAALKAADETFDAASAWDDVVTQLITCKASNA